jgi:hypothetical protein
MAACLVLGPAAAAAGPRDYGDRGEEYDEAELDQERTAADAPTEAEQDGEQDASDHSSHVDGLGLGFLGARFVPAATLGPGRTVTVTPAGDAVLTIGTDEVTVPVVGARYWLHPNVGIELGLGFNVQSGSEAREIPNPDPTLARSEEADAPSTSAVVAHLALPISMYSVSHFNLLLLPELDIGYSSASYDSFEVSTSGEALDLSLKGLLVGAAARVGTELSFGFLDLPGLALQASFGLRVEYRRHKGAIGDAEMVVADTAFGTSWYDDPWELLAGNIAALYYF